MTLAQATVHANTTSDNTANATHFRISPPEDYVCWDDLIVYQLNVRWHSLQSNPKARWSRCS